VTPPPAAAQRAASVRPDRQRAARAGTRRPSLRVLEARPRRRTGRWLRIASGVLVAGSLLGVVVAHSMLAEDQVRLTAAQQQVAAEQAVHRQLLASVAAAENPARIIAEAKRLNLVPPSSVTQLPAVPLGPPAGGSTTGTTTPGNARSKATDAAGGASSGR
jgi:hypothetical protein